MRVTLLHLIPPQDELEIIVGSIMRKKQQLQKTNDGDSNQ